MTAGKLSGQGWLFIIFLSLIASSRVLSGPASYSLALGNAEQQLGPVSTLYYDNSASLSPQSVLEQDFTPIGREFVPFPAENGSYWLRFSLNNTSAFRERRVFSFDYPHVKSLVLYAIENGQAVELASTNAELELQQRELTSRFPALLFDVAGNSTTQYLVKINLAGKANHALEYELRIYPEYRFFNEQIKSFIIFSGFIGFMLSLMIYNLILYRRLAIRGYLYYSIYLAGQFVGVMSYEGFFYLMPGPFSINTVIMLMTIAPTLSGLFLINFGRDLLQLQKLMPAYNRFYSVVTALLVILMLLSSLELSGLNLAMESVMLSMLVLTAILAYRLYRRGSQAAKYLMLSFAVITLGYGIEVLLYSVENLEQSVGFLSVDTLYWMERYFYYSCSFIQMLLLSSSLANYVAEIRTQNDIAQQLALENMQESNRIKEAYSTQLEHDIAQRTEEITRQAKIMSDQTARLQLMDKLKSRFFANISHEFRTPLTLIRGPIQRVIAGYYGALGEEANNALLVCSRNTERLSRLIDELLMLSELGSGALKLKTTSMDVGQFCRRIAGLFVHTALEKNIEFSLEIPHQELPARFDSHKFEKVICNLLSNAFKYTPRGGWVKLSISVPASGDRSTGSFIEIVVEDNGPGINENEQATIFERFYRGNGNDNSAVEGSGIGLALVKELVELHGGDVRMESAVSNGAGQRENPGSRFIISLPLGEDHLLAEEFGRQQVRLTDAVIDEDKAKAPATIAGNASKWTLLVVEDNRDMLAFIVSQFNRDYRVLQARHGREALELLVAEAVDLVISDVMMPEMDGISMLETLRQAPALRHLPVILLTARASDEDRLLALRARADDFLAKPFNGEELALKVRNLLQRPTVVAKSSSGLVASSERPVSSADASFIAQARKLTLQHLADNAFDVEALSEHLSMSRSTLHRRMEQAAGTTPALFIRQLRLETAHHHISNHIHRTLAETAYAVGFSHPGYFSRLYKKFLAERSASNRITN